MEITDHVLLNNGVKMPVFGLGTYQIKDRETIKNSLDCALGNGYRLIDTAAVYQNESHIGHFLPELLKKHGLKREDIFITTKLSPKDHGSDEARKAVQMSLENLQLDYIDLYLIHWPGKQGLKREDKRNADFRRETWKTLEDIYSESNKLRAIGISNYTANHLDELLSECRVVPAVLQSEFHPDYQQNNVLELCRQKNIHFTSYSTLGQGQLIGDPRFGVFAEKYGKTPEQVLLRWALQRECSIIPKSCKSERIVINSNIFDFELSEDDMNAINNLDRGVKYAWNGNDVA